MNNNDQPTDWDHLLESSNSLLPHEKRDRILRSWKGIEQEAQRLASHQSSHIAPNQLKDFAAECGVDIRNQNQYVSHIQQIHPVARDDDDVLIHEEKQKSLSNVPKLISGSIHPNSTMNLTNFLKYHHEYIISSTIQECQLLSARHFRKKYSDSMQKEWNDTKSEILNYLGCNNANENNKQTDNTNAGLNHSLLNFELDDTEMSNLFSDINTNGRNGGDNSDQMRMEECYGRIIYNLAQSMKPSRPVTDYHQTSDDHYVQTSNVINPINEFCSLHRDLLKQDLVKEDLCDLWQCLYELILKCPRQPTQSEFLQNYQTKEIGLQRFFVNGAKEYLQTTYLEFMKKKIKENPSEAKIGGRPGNRSIVKAFVRLKFNQSMAFNQQEKIKIDGQLFPLWPLIYYCFRIGDLDSCIHFANLGSQYLDALKNALGNLREQQFKFLANLDETKSVDQMIDCYRETPVSLEQSIWRSLDSESKKVLCADSDPYQAAMYLLIGKSFADVNDLQSVIATADDFLWFKLQTLIDSGGGGNNNLPEWISRPTNSNSAFRVGTLTEFQSLIRHDMGPQFFDSTIDFIIALLLSQQFETCIEFLWKCGQPDRDDIVTKQCVHIGICLRYYGLLSDENENICNLLPYVSKYCGKFRKNNSPQFVFYYLYLFEESGIHELTEYLCEANDDFAQTVIGTFDENKGIDLGKGLLMTHCGQDKLKEICTLSAKKAKNNGESEHCVKLLILCGDYQFAAKQCCQLLASFVEEKPFNQSKTKVLDLAKQLFLANKQGPNYHSLGNDVRFMSETSKSNLVTAIYFAEFYDSIHATPKDSDAALKIIERNNIIPISEHQSFDANQISKLDRELMRFIPSICYNVMKIFIEQSDQLKYSRNRFDLLDVSSKRKAKEASDKCKRIYNFFNQFESRFKPTGTDQVAQEIANLYFKVKMD